MNDCDEPAVGLSLEVEGFRAILRHRAFFFAIAAQNCYRDPEMAAQPAKKSMTWHKGRAIILQNLGSCADSAEDVSRKLESLPYRRPGQFVLITSNRNPRYALTRALEMIRREGAFRERAIVLSLVNAMESDVDMARSIEVQQLGANLWHIIALHGYMQEPHAPRTLGRAHEISGGEIDKDNPDTFYVLPRELIVEYVGHRMARWQRSLFGFLSRNVSYAPDYFFIPHTQIIEFTWMLRA